MELRKIYEKVYRKLTAYWYPSDDTLEVPFVQKTPGHGKRCFVGHHCAWVVLSVAVIKEIIKESLKES